MQEIQAKGILSGTKNPEFWFNARFNMNLYRGCVFGCIYCDSRSDCYHVENFDEVAYKVNGLELLEKELKGKRIKGVVGIGSMSDPYNPLEKKLELNREALKLINKYGFGVHLSTKSPLVTRDIDIFRAIQEHSPVSVGVTITTADDKLAGDIEIHAPKSSQRFEAVKALSDAGVYTGVMMMPVLPFINDTFENMDAIVKMASNAGARYIYPWFGVTMRLGQREHFFKALDRSFPGIKDKYLRTYGGLYECRSPHYSKLLARFKSICDDHGIFYEMKDIIAGAERCVRLEQEQMGFS